MQVKDLQRKRALRTALLVLLLCMAGMGKMYAQDFTVGELNYQVNNDGVSVTVTGHVNGTAATGSLTIPETVTFEGTDYSVTVIGNNAFYGCSGFTGNLTIPNSVNTIGEFAFHNCSGFMGSLVIPNSVATIGTLAFLDCVGFTSVTCFAETPPALGDSYYSYTGSCVFGGWSANTPIYIPCGCEESYASSSWVRDGFSDFVGMCGGTVTLVSIAEEYGTVTGGGLFEAGQTCTITATANEGYVFTKWTHDDRLVSLDLEYTFYVAGDMTFEAHFVPEGNIVFVDATVKSICTANWDTNEDGELSYSEAAAVTRLGQVFSNNVTITSFDELQFFTGLTLINMNSFYGCSSLSSITIPNTVTGIGTCAFASCSGLSSITIPAYVDRVGSMAFDGCSSLSSVYFEGNVAQWCRIDFIQGSNPLIQAHNLSIGHCIVTDLVIPEGVTEIKTDAFRGATCLTSLTLPNSVTTIGYSAFSGCSNLNEAIMLGVNPPIIGRNAFANSNFTIYVPYESLNDYKTATNWSDYEDRIFPMAYTTIPGYGEGEGNYRFIASPLVENTDPTMVDNMITETPYDLYRFDQSEDAEWQNYKFPENTPNFFLTNGQGYLYANAEDVNLIFKGEFNEDETKEVELAYDADADFAGWNLVGNPFPVSAYANKSYYTMNEDGTAVEPNMVSSATAIPSCTGVMVKAEAQGETIVFNTTTPETASNKGCVQIALSQVVDRGGISTGSTTLQDKAIVSFNAGDRLEKFVFNKNNARISISQEGKDYAIACAEKQGEMPLNFKATKNGTYTLSVNVESADVDYLHLIDNLTGADVDLLVEPNYTFEAKSTDYASRFRLVFSVCEDANGDNGTFAFINNGNIIVTGAEDDAVLQIVDVLGHVIVSTDVARNVSTNGMTPGVYVLRLIQGEKVKTQKMVID